MQVQITIIYKGHHKKYSENPENFPKEIQRRLDFLDKNYIKKRIKLLHIQE